MRPKISICIPAYQRVQFLKRLLNSIREQSFHDFEVIVTDDSPGNEVSELCNEFREAFPLIYHKNVTTQGTPDNWNQAISKGKGDWVKDMHDDDWYANDKSLEEFIRTIEANPDARFLFSKYHNVNEENGETEVRKPNRRRLE